LKRRGLRTKDMQAGEVDPFSAGNLASLGAGKKRVVRAVATIAGRAAGNAYSHPMTVVRWST